MLASYHELTTINTSTAFINLNV